MNQLSPHFRRREFACRCGCGFDTVDAGTLAVLERVRSHFGQPVSVTSGCRCDAHNRAVGGATHSQHRLGRAADIQVTGVAPATVADFIADTVPTASIGRYATFTHVDTRSTGPARWQA